MMRMASFTVALMVIAATITIRVDGHEFSHHQEVKILRHLKRLNKPAVKSIKLLVKKPTLLISETVFSTSVLLQATMFWRKSPTLEVTM
ncbi:hypothetical protein F2Q68_00023907 [Brassica cretica]|uniref:Uncharacterized protein n=1 Tax=Brassica cretica TaxID=69181 RepID=A0A8S9IB82_BRACR|nr:hypothetical protein F2Q68_00023907 [Brassica cretica]